MSEKPSIDTFDHKEKHLAQHNPINLSNEQIGVDQGWRLLLQNELNTIEAFPKNDETIEEWNGEAWDVMSTLAHDSDTTYRTKRPETM